MKLSHLLSFSLLLCAGQPTFAQKPELIVPIGHTRGIRSVAFSPNSKYALSGSYDATLKLWEARSGKLLKTFEGHDKVVNSVAFSKDGRLALSGSEDGNMKLWSIGGGNLLKTFSGHGSEVNSVAFSPDGHFVLSGSQDSTLKLWAMGSGELLRTFQGHKGSVNTVKFSPDARLILSGSADSTIKLWDVNNGKLLITFQGHADGCTSVSFSRNGDLVLSGSNDGTLKLWEVNSGKLLKTFDDKLDVYSVDFSPDGRLALSGSYDGTLKLWEIDSGKRIRTFQGHGNWVNSVAFSPDGHFALSGSQDNTLKLWSITSNKVVRTFEGYRPGVDLVAFSPGGRSAVVGSLTNIRKLWKWDSTNVLEAFEGMVSGRSEVFSSDGRSITSSADGHSLLSGSWDGTLKLWKFNEDKLLSKAFQGHKGSIYSVAISQNGRFALSGSDDNTVKIWEVSSGKLLNTLPGHKFGVSSVSFSPDSRFIVSGSGDRTLRLWEVSSGKLLRIFKGHENGIYSVIFSPDGKRFLSGSYDGTLKLWDVNNSNPPKTFTIPGEGVESVAVYAGGRIVLRKQVVKSFTFSPDGRFLLTGSWKGVLYLWDIESGKLLQTFKGHTNAITSVAFSPDGKLVLSGSYDKTLKLWEVKSGGVLQTFSGHIQPILSVCYATDGQYIFSKAFDNSTKIWSPSTGKELATLITVDSTDWVVTTPIGLFDASPGAMKRIHYVVNDSTDHSDPWSIIELQQLKHRYYQPGLLPILMGYSKGKLRIVPAFEGVPLPPAIELAIRNDTLHLGLKNRKGGIGKVSVFIGPAEVVQDLRSNAIRDFSEDTLSLTLPLNRFVNYLDTLNAIRVVAFNSAGWISSRPEEIIYRFTARQRGSQIAGVALSTERDTLRLQAVVVGTSNIGLRFAHKDAEQIANGLRLAASELLGKANVNVQLLNSQPNSSQQFTKADIVKALEAGKSLRPHDTFVLYLAGHGVSYEGQEGSNFYYLTALARSADVSYLADADNRQTYAISSAELTDYLNQIPARKKLLILDVCAAGKGVEKLLVTARDIPASQIRALDELQGRTGFYVLAGSAADAVSYESNIYGQGLLTYALLKGMRGGKLRREGEEEYLNVEQWLNYAVEQVPVLAKEIRGIQEPFYRGLDTDQIDNHRSFDVGKITKAIKAQIRISEPKPVLLVRSFQEETQLDDLLALTAKIEGALIDLSARGPDAPMLFMEAKDYPGAYALLGRYIIKGKTVSVKCKVMKATTRVGEFRVTSQKNKLSELAQSILTRTQALVKR